MIAALLPAFYIVFRSTTNGLDMLKKGGKQLLNMLCVGIESGYLHHELIVIVCLTLEVKCLEGGLYSPLYYNLGR